MRELKRLPEFPDFPTDGRKVDRWSIKFGSLAEAKKELDSKDFELLSKELQKKGKNPDEELDAAKKKVYFLLDDNVPNHLRERFENTIITREGRENFFKSQHSPLYWE